ncbi:MAG: carbon-nitrogen hydrolase family protein [Myxococcota bacterium]
MTSPSTTKVALVQAEPTFLDTRASLETALDRIESAAREGAKLVAFGESWLPGYPFWVDVAPSAAAWDQAEVKEIHALLRAQSVTIDGPEVQRLRDAAADLKVAITMGLHERVDRGPGNRTLYNALVTIGDDGGVAVHHRKLVPTHGERLVWGPGDGQGLHAADTAAGRVGGLICWEHWMPLARQALHDSGEHIHVAQWPTVNATHMLASQHYAFEGRCFVLAVGSILRMAALPAALRPAEFEADALALRGGSCIAAPDGSWLVEPVYDEERTIFADLDFAIIHRESMTLDVSGHYGRRDVFQFDVRRDRASEG